MKEIMEKELLQFLAERVGVENISDLRYAENGFALRNALRGLEPGDYPVREWNDAICYLCGKQRVFASGEDARMYLLFSNIVKEYP